MGDVSVSLRDYRPAQDLLDDSKLDWNTVLPGDVIVASATFEAMMRLIDETAEVGDSQPSWNDPPQPNQGRRFLQYSKPFATMGGMVEWMKTVLKRSSSKGGFRSKQIVDVVRGLTPIHQPLAASINPNFGPAPDPELGKLDRLKGVRLP